MLEPLFIAVSIVLSASSSQAAASELRGSCQYSSDILERGVSETVFVQCNAAHYMERNGTTMIDFRQRGSGSMILFEGTPAGSRIEVSSITLRTGTRFAAEGTCEIFEANGQTSMVSCLARARSTWYAANFKVSI